MNDHEPLTITPSIELQAFLEVQATANNVTEEDIVKGGLLLLAHLVRESRQNRAALVSIGEDARSDTQLKITTIPCGVTITLSTPIEELSTQMLDFFPSDRPQTPLRIIYD